METIRAVSTKIFGNEKVVEVVRALAAENDVATAQQLSKRTMIDHSMVRDVLVRLVDAKVLLKLPRSSARAPQYYEVRSPEVWIALVQLADAIDGQGADVEREIADDLTMVHRDLGDDAAGQAGQPRAR